MEIDGYTIEQDEGCSLGEQFFVTRNGHRVGFIRMDCGLFRVSASYPPKSFLLHESADNAFDGFASCGGRRAAMRKAVKALKAYYNDSSPPLASIAKVFPDFSADSSGEQGALPF